MDIKEPKEVVVTLTVEEMQMIKKALNYYGDRQADTHGYSSGEPYWDLMNKLNGNVYGKYKNIEGCKDKQYLYDNLSEETLRLIEAMLEAYNTGRIELKEPRHENGEPNHDGEFELIINDDTYVEKGYEILVLKWYESFEDTGYLVECLI